MLRQSKLTAAQAEAASLKAQLAASPRNSRRKWRADLQPVAASSPVAAEEPTLAVSVTEGKVIEPVPADAQLQGVAPDSLIEINGIGSVFERRLKAAGIRTFRNLASQTPERLRENIAPAK